MPLKDRSEYNKYMARYKKKYMGFVRILIGAFKDYDEFDVFMGLEPFSLAVVPTPNVPIFLERAPSLGVDPSRMRHFRVTLIEMAKPSGEKIEVG